MARRPKDTPAPAPATDARVRRSRAKVLGAAFDLLSEGGVGGLSVDEVARRSGVAKTTIYRHWPTREALVVDACARLTDEARVPDTGTVRGDVTAVLTHLGRLLYSARWATVLPSIVDVAERSPEFADVHRRIQHGHAEPLRTVLQRAIDRGELPATIDRQTLIAGLMGPLFYRRWFSREPIDRRFVVAVVDAVLGRRAPSSRR